MRRRWCWLATGTRQAQWRASARLHRQRAAADREAPARRAPDLSVARRADARTGACRRRANISASTIPTPSCCSARKSPEALAERLVERHAGWPIRRSARRCGTAAWQRSRLDGSDDPSMRCKLDDAPARAQEAGRCAYCRAADRRRGQARRRALRRLWRQRSIPTPPSRCGSATARSQGWTERGKDGAVPAPRWAAPSSAPPATSHSISHRRSPPTRRRSTRR